MVCFSSPSPLCHSALRRSREWRVALSIVAVHVAAVPADVNTLCADWAAHGECLRNPTYMLRDCSSSCARTGITGKQYTQSVERLGGDDSVEADVSIVEVVDTEPTREVLTRTSVDWEITSAEAQRWITDARVDGFTELDKKHFQDVAKALREAEVICRDELERVDNGHQMELVRQADKARVREATLQAHARSLDARLQTAEAEIQRLLHAQERQGLKKRLQGMAAELEHTTNEHRALQAACEDGRKDAATVQEQLLDEIADSETRVDKVRRTARFRKHQLWRRWKDCQRKSNRCLSSPHTQQQDEAASITEVQSCAVNALESFAARGSPANNLWESLWSIRWLPWAPAYELPAAAGVALFGGVLLSALWPLVAVCLHLTLRAIEWFYSGRRPQASAKCS